MAALGKPGDGDPSKVEAVDKKVGELASALDALKASVAAMVASEGFSGAVTVTSNCSNEPLTLLMARWRTENVISECVGSSFQVPAW